MLEAMVYSTKLKFELFLVPKFFNLNQICLNIINRQSIMEKILTLLPLKKKKK
jgi:hypothetical protein